MWHYAMSGDLREYLNPTAIRGEVVGAVLVKAGGNKKAGLNSVTIMWVTLLRPAFQKFWIPPLSVSIFSQ
jgi:hypothetical protein